MKAGQKITVLGDVKNPGMYSLTDGITNVVEALGASGGFTETASQRNVILIRREGDVAKRYVLNIHKVAKRGELAYNAPIRKGDILFVPSSLVANIDGFADHLVRWLSPIISAEYGIILGYEAKKAIQDEAPQTRANISLNVNQ